MCTRASAVAFADAVHVAADGVPSVGPQVVQWPVELSGFTPGAQAPFTPPTVHHAPKATKAQHGVLGTVAKVSGSTLPFTGFPLWVALVVALGLIGTGLSLRRRGSTLGVR